jgi:hypothetical protein
MLRCDWHVRFGSKADMCGAPTHVRFTPNSDRKSGSEACYCSYVRDWGLIGDSAFLMQLSISLT